MFKLSSVSPTYVVSVTISIPDGTKSGSKHVFKARFKRLPQDELKELTRRLRPQDLAEGEEALTDEELAREVMAGWEDVLDEDGNALEFNAENLDKVLSIHPVPGALAVAFFDSLKTAKQKN